MLSTSAQLVIGGLLAAALVVVGTILLWRRLPWPGLATRNWRLRRLRTGGAVLAIALGTGAVVWVTCCYESVRATVMQWAGSFVGKSHITIESAWGKYDTLPQRLVQQIENLRDGQSGPPVANIRSVTPLLVQRLKALTVRRDELAAAQADASLWRPSMDDLDVYGIDLAREFQVRDWHEMLVAGRMLRPDDRFACVLELEIAREEGIGLGDYVLIWRSGAVGEEPAALEVVGLVKRRRIARFLKGVALVQLPVLQEVCLKQALINSVDIVLARPEMNPLLETARRIQVEVRRAVPHAQVRSAVARQSQMEAVQNQQQMVLVLMSCVALLTALFIILSTLSMGMVERIAQFGLLRCVGCTRAQLAGLTLLEVVPLGAAGIVLGVPVGLGLTALSVWLVPEYVGEFMISRTGILLAAGAGLATTLIAALLPALAAAGVSPLEATRPRARGGGLLPVAILSVLAAVLLYAQFYVLDHFVRRDLYFGQWAAVAVVLLYFVFALAAPLAVWLVSRVAVPLVAQLTGVRVQLLQDQVGRAVWRSAGIVCGLMVGLSLIVGLVVFDRSFRSGWQFPKQFPEAYLWSFDQIPGDVAQMIAETPGIRDYTIANAPNVLVEERPVVGEDLVRSFTYFLGIDPDTFFDLVHMEFIEGDEQTARALLHQGGHIVIAQDFARARKKGVREVVDEDGNVAISNQVRVWLNGRWRSFTVAGVVDSPALDIAASYFQVQSEARVASTGSVIGTAEDLKRHYGLDGTKLILLNFDLPPAPVPPDWPPPRDSPEARWLPPKYYDERKPLAQRWQNYREEHQVLGPLRARLDAPQVFYGTARELKDEIDGELTKMTTLLAAIPTVALLVAAIGVANLMTANVASRRKQIAVMRAVGATRGLVLRTVVGEALVLGVLGSGLGLGLGLHMSWNTIIMMDRMWGMRIAMDVPWEVVGVAIGLTIGLCVLAGIAPARHAARTNIIDALHVA